MRRAVQEQDANLKPADARALRLQLDQATLAAEAAKTHVIATLRRRQSIEERLAREEIKDVEAYPRDRVMEARAEVASLIGLLRCEEDLGEHLSQDDILAYLWKALDRLYRAIDGESYIAQYRRLSEESDGAFHYTPPPPESLPPDLGRPVK